MDRNLPKVPPAYQLVAFESLDSTNEQARRMAAEGAAHGTLIWAHSQSAGRGRRGRTWVSEPGNLYCSLILRSEKSVAEAAQLSFAASLAVTEALREASAPFDRPEIACKWPNDVLLNGKKVAGILLECQAKASQGNHNPGLDWLVLGVGVNVSHHPEETEFPATSFGITSGMTVESVLEGFAQHFEAWFDRWSVQGFEPIRNAWLANAKGIGGTVIARLGKETLEGKFAGMDEEGALILETEGNRRHITAADIFFPQDLGHAAGN